MITSVILDYFRLSSTMDIYIKVLIRADVWIHPESSAEY